MFSNFDLPVIQCLPELQAVLRHYNTCVLQAPPGAGKSTIVPLALMNESWLVGKKIIVLEPRRLAAKSIAHRMSDILGVSVGSVVGYRIRFETCVSDNTKIEIVTEGILTRMLQEDAAIENIGVVLFDEFHERSIHADTSLALCREVQQVLRPELRLLLMSATLNIPELEQGLQCKIVRSNGRLYSVDIFHEGECDERMIAQFVARTIQMAMQKHEGDVLAFFPGQAEILACEDLLRAGLQNCKIHTLYGQMSFDKQYAAMFPDKHGKRKIVLATNIAETSVTIDGIKIVVDSGYERIARFNPNTGLTRLETTRISLDSAEQRAGRAGRTASGVCYRMWSRATELQLQQHRVAEIEVADLSSMVLTVLAWGVQDVFALPWVTKPPRGNVFQAIETLQGIGALEGMRCTLHGKQILSLPMHPRLAHMLLHAKKIGQLALATDIAALLEERDPLANDNGIDINIRIVALRRYRERGVGSKQFARIEKIATQYRSVMNVSAENDVYDEYFTGLLLAYAYPERIACARVGNNAQFQLANGSIAAVGHTDDLAHESWLALASVSEREKCGKIFLASRVDPRDLVDMISIVERVTWDTKKGGVIAQKETRIGSILLQSQPLLNPNKLLIEDALSQEIAKNGKHLLDWSEEVTQWQNKISSLAIWNAWSDVPDLRTDTLLATNTQWLMPYLGTIKHTEELRQIPLLALLQAMVPYELLAKIDEYAPEFVRVPSGSDIRLHYSPKGESPVLAVRLQECFGMKHTPTVNNGSVSVVLHLLSPGYKIVQITSDIESFWTNAYFEVRKDLRIRYQKHFWPENPREVVGVKGTKKQNGL